MRQKKKEERESQSNLTSFITNDQVEEDPAITEKKMEKEVQKLVKLRKDIEQKCREEHRVMRNILKMQINENILQYSEGHLEEEDEKDDEREEYWMMTREAGLEQGNLSVFKLILEGYG